MSEKYQNRISLLCTDKFEIIIEIVEYMYMGEIKLYSSEELQHSALVFGCRFFPTEMRSRSLY